MQRGIEPTVCASNFVHENRESMVPRFNTLVVIESLCKKRHICRRIPTGGFRKAHYGSGELCRNIIQSLIKKPAVVSDSIGISLKSKSNHTSPHRKQGRSNVKTNHRGNIQSHIITPGLWREMQHFVYGTKFSFLQVGGRGAKLSYVQEGGDALGVIFNG
jgi:hypothetical protein